MTIPRVEPVALRALRADDEAEVRAAQRELAAEGFPFVFWDAGATWSQVLAQATGEQAGSDLPPGRVPATFLVAVHDGHLVGRTSIRHALTDVLLNEGGHIGYCVRPAWRRRGFATSLLRQSLDVTDGLGIEHVLVTCDVDNVASRRVIEAAGGVLEDVRDVGSGPAKRRYWITRPTAARP